MKKIRFRLLCAGRKPLGRACRTIWQMLRGMPCAGGTCSAPAAVKCRTRPPQLSYAAGMLFILLAVGTVLLSGCSQSEPKSQNNIQQDLKKVRSMELSYAKGFAVDYYEGGYTLLTIEDKQRFLLVPEGKEIPGKLDKDITPIQQPIERIYLCASSAMNLFVGLEALDCITLSGTKEEGWYVEEAARAMRDGKIAYAGKYNAPDYELILSRDCQLAVQSQMIYHTPEVKEELESFGIPVLVDASSAEEEPLGRTEWIKLYGALTGKEEKAERLFEKQKEAFEQSVAEERINQSVAVFYITSNGTVSVRKPGDYIPKLVEYAGGTYAITSVPEEDSGTSTMNMQMEQFYAEAKDADYLIYNSTISGELHSIDELLAQNGLLADFRAVKNGNVFCLMKNLYQESLQMGLLAKDIHLMLTKEEAADHEFTFLYRLR